MSLSAQKQEFVLNEFWISAWNASVQRTRLYGNASDDKSKAGFKSGIKTFVTHKLVIDYESRCTEERPFENISTLAHFGTSGHRRILGELGYNYGVAQKLLNLILKYYWCAGRIGEPPHCAVDRIV